LPCEARRAKWGTLNLNIREITAMTQEVKKTSKPEAKGTPWSKVLAGALYTLTFLFVLGFIWQSLGDFL
jgi:hypothetical protein